MNSLDKFKNFLNPDKRKKDLETLVYALKINDPSCTSLSLGFNPGYLPSLHFSDGEVLAFFEVLLRNYEEIASRK